MTSATAVAITTSSISQNTHARGRIRGYTIAAWLPFAVRVEVSGRIGSPTGVSSGRDGVAFRSGVSARMTIGTGVVGRSLISTGAAPSAIPDGGDAGGDSIAARGAGTELGPSGM